MSHIHQIRQRAGAVQQEIAVRWLRRAIAEMMNVEMGVELDHQHAIGLSGQLVVDRQGAEMIARDPEEEVARAQDLPGRSPPLFAPAGVSLDSFKGEFLQAYLVSVDLRPRGRTFTAIVGQDFTEFVGDKGGPRAGAAAAEEVEREDDQTGFHGCRRPGRGLRPSNAETQRPPSPGISQQGQHAKTAEDETGRLRRFVPFDRGDAPGIGVAWVIRRRLAGDRVDDRLKCRRKNGLNAGHVELDRLQDAVDLGRGGLQKVATLIKRLQLNEDGTGRVKGYCDCIGRIRRRRSRQNEAGPGALAGD